MKHRLSSILLLLPLICGCEYEFDLKDLDEESRLQLISVSGMCDSTFFKVNKAAAVNSHDTKVAEINQMEFMINGQAQKITGDSADGSPYYIVDAPVKAGDKIAMRIKADGMKEVSSETVVPAKAEVLGIKHEFKKELVNDVFVADTENFLIFDIELAGKVTEEDFFAVEIYTRAKSKVIFEDGHEDINEHGYYQSIVDDSDFLSFESGNSSGWFNSSLYDLKFDNSSGGHYLFMTSGKSVVNGHLIVKSYYSENYSYDWEFYPPEDERLGKMITGREEVEYRYRLVLYKVSPELYRYCKARNLQDNNVLIEVGLSPATFSYTNVVNGFGVVGAFSEPVFSDWVFSPWR